MANKILKRIKIRQITIPNSVEKLYYVLCFSGKVVLIVVIEILSSFTPLIFRRINKIALVMIPASNNSQTNVREVVKMCIQPT